MGYTASGRLAQLAPPTRWGAVAGFLTCAALLAAYALIAWSAVLHKGAAVEEPTHAVAGWMQLARHDFRINPEDPPLWKYLAGRANAPVELPVDYHPELWKRALDDASEGRHWCRAVLYGTEGGAAFADAALARSRAIMLGVAVLLGAMLGWWAWKLAGPMAAVVAVAFFALDPNFLAHGPLIDQDIAVSLAMLATVYAAWRVGRRATLLRLLVLALLAAVTLSVSFSGLFVGLVVAAVIAARVFVPAAWPLMRLRPRGWVARPSVALAVIVLCLSAGVAGLWATYQFRFRPAPDASAVMNIGGIVAEVGATEAKLQSRGNRRLATQPSEEPSVVVKAALIADAKRLLPQSWIYGMLETYQGLLTRPAYMLGQMRRGGWWSYFPFAMAVKTPIATLLALPLAVWVLVGAWRRAGPMTEASVWTIVCVTLPVVLYLVVAMLARLDFGIRHLLPIYPFLFIGIGVAAALLLQQRRRRWPKVTVVVLLAIGLAVETRLAYPHYVPFFNAATRPVPIAKYRYLGESNIDLGQDLPLLAQWQRTNADRKLLLSYHGAADPALYGIAATDVRKTGLDLRERWPNDPAAVLAVSATHLQGFLPEPEARRLYGTLRDRTPLAILGGGSIYLFELTPAK